MLIFVNHANYELIFHSCCSRYAKSVGAKHFHTSAKMNKGIDELFLDLTKCMYI